MRKIVDLNRNLLIYIEIYLYILILTLLFIITQQQMLDASEATNLALALNGFNFPLLSSCEINKQVLASEIPDLAYLDELSWLQATDIHDRMNLPLSILSCGKAMGWITQCNDC